MVFEVYDYRTVNRNVLVTPEIRARLYHMKPGQVDSRHSHDLGQEVFLILEGRAEFTIEGHTEVLGPGQMCIAMADEIHQVRNVLEDKPTIMYLSVTPHIQPTHTRRTEAGERHLPGFRSNRGYDVDEGENRAIEELIDAHLAASAELAEEAERYAGVQSEMASKWRQGLLGGDPDAVREARNAMAEAVCALHKRLYAGGRLWNELAPRGDDPLTSGG